MKIVADRVFPDEPCEAYFTGPKMRHVMGPDGQPVLAERMIEMVFVYRDDAIASYEQDFGPAEDYEYVPPLLMPSYGAETVASMQWHGERHRHDERWAKRIREYRESSTLFADVLRQEEQRSAVIRNQSVFGPALVTQRNTPYSGQRTWRKWKAERDRRLGKVQL